jgi:hypothetical protein
MQLAALFQRFESTGSSITSEKVPTLGMYCFAIRTSSAQPAAAPASPPRALASSGLVLRFREPDAGEYDAEDEIKLAWKAWMKEHITISEGIQCDVLAWWKDNASRFPLIAKAAKIVLATPASEAICERLFKRAKHIGTTDRMARLHDNMFEMLVMAQYNISRHGGVEAMEVSIYSCHYCHCNAH